MPVAHCVVECQTLDSFRVKQIAGLFDVPVATKQREEFRVQVPAVEEDWQIGAIVGPSGSGKSTIARHVFGESLYQPGTWPADAAVIDGFPQDASVRDVTALLTSVGLSSPPAWIKPYQVLSNGERFRCDLARGLFAGGLVVFDEFTSVVDRTVAKIGSLAVRKHIRRTPGLRFVAVTCHYDCLEWLEPDWVVDMASRELARRSLRRPAIKLAIRRSSCRHWRLFARHHYLNSNPITGSRCYVAEVEGQPACFVAVRSSAGHPGMRRISRIVTLPDFQGVGIGMATLNAVAELTLALPGIRQVTITTGHPAIMHGLSRSKRWRLRQFSPLGCPPTGRTSTLGALRKTQSAGRAVASFYFVP